MFTHQLTSINWLSRVWVWIKLLKLLQYILVLCNPIVLLTPQIASIQPPHKGVLNIPPSSQSLILTTGTGECRWVWHKLAPLRLISWRCPTRFLVVHLGLRPLFGPNPKIRLEPLRLISWRCPTQFLMVQIRSGPLFCPRTGKNLICLELQPCCENSFIFLKLDKFLRSDAVKFHSFGTWQSALQSYCWYNWIRLKLGRLLRSRAVGIHLICTELGRLFCSHAAIRLVLLYLHSNPLFSGPFRARTTFLSKTWNKTGIIKSQLLKVPNPLKVVGSNAASYFGKLGRWYHDNATDAMKHWYRSKSWDEQLSRFKSHSCVAC